MAEIDASHLYNYSAWGYTQDLYFVGVIVDLIEVFFGAES